MKNVNTHTEPKIELRAEEFCLGIRVVTPFKGMLGVRDTLSRELDLWLAGKRLEGVGPRFLRLHVIDMRGMMDIEVGVKASSRLEGDGRVMAGVLPRGRYATFIYRGGGYQGNKALLLWIKSQGLPMDVEETVSGDAFGCRYEALLSDPNVEPRRTHQDIELSIRLKD